ncbi:L,D-transpeptidase family protein [Thermodesulfobacterium hydrogeniphilum]|uniref:L,D-transpeptidase family protein n=1 Tax=Thermodesulfobacterium hydrogeniphilum TaxID=161156 RepID=UPI00068B52D1|nr:L,D-transpeptidase family protein [Thermodesulfobacterium hydrogeniphilum]
MKFHKILFKVLIALFYITLFTCQVKAFAFSFIYIFPHRFIYLKNKTYIIQKNDTLVDLAVTFEVGYYHLTLANPKIDPWVPKPKKKIIIPYQILIPQEFSKYFHSKSYIIINLPEMKLYYFRFPKLFVFPIGVGDVGRLPDPGIYKIIKKKKDPFWYPPPSIKAEDPTLPDVVPPGPNNPMGKYALYLSRGLYAIHGTNKIYSIGRRSTHGCIRLYPQHIKFLYNNVTVGTTVQIVYEPYKLAVENKNIYIQAYEDIEKRIKHPIFYIIKKLDKLIKHQNYQINLLKLEKILKNPDGLIYKIGKIK